MLHRLRERDVQRIENITHLFPHPNYDLQRAVSEDVLKKQGKGVLFVLDGFDELPASMRREGLLPGIIKGEVLPESIVLVTSRPTATTDLSMLHPQIHRRVEILGFTQESIKDYTSSILSAEILQDFLFYLSSSMISSSMYTPLNAAIIVELYRANTRKGIPMPNTLTQVYTQLCLTLLQRYIQSIDPQNLVYMRNFTDLSSNYHSQVMKLSQLAFEQFEKHKLVFHSDSVPEELVRLGFLDCVPAVFGEGKILYNFLHLTLQEFLAAYYITHHSDGIDIFRRYSMDNRWQRIWRFVSGLTGFQFFKDSVKCDAFACVAEERIEVKDLFLHCQFEGQIMFDYAAVWGKNCVYSNQPCSSKLDEYALAYCIANCLSPTSWCVVMNIGGGSDESFMWGLNSCHSGNGSISHLEIYHVHPEGLGSYPRNILQGITQFIISVDDDVSLHSLVQAIPMMKNLTVLSVNLPLYASELPWKLLDVISQSKVATLLLQYGTNRILSDRTFLSSLHNLVKYKLSSLAIEPAASYTPNGALRVCTIPLCDVLFKSSSLHQLTLKLPIFEKKSLNLLEKNTSLTNVHIASDRNLPILPLLNVVQRNKSIKELRWGCFNSKYIDILDSDLRTNTTLRQLTLETLSSRRDLDPRIKVICSMRQLKYKQEEKQEEDSGCRDMDSESILPEQESDSGSNSGHRFDLLY